MKLITDPTNENIIGYISDSVIFGFDRNNKPVEIGRLAPSDDPLEMIKAWQQRGRPTPIIR